MGLVGKKINNNKNWVRSWWCARAQTLAATLLDSDWRFPAGLIVHRLSDCSKGLGGEGMNPFKWIHTFKSVRALRDRLQQTPEWGKEVEKKGEPDAAVNKMSQGAEVAVLHQPSSNCGWFPGCIQSPKDCFSPQRLHSWLPEWKAAWWLHGLDAQHRKGVDITERKITAENQPAWKAFLWGLLSQAS